MAECIHQLAFTHLTIQTLAVQRGNRQQKRESVYRQRDGEVIFLAQATSSGTVWENSLILYPCSAVCAR
ncbi:hypothetical protein SS482266_1061 [Shigella sonnei 4822-66]|nr:hypothetical protein SS482266_1061 [Shigella sonnei 4822-66]